MEYVLPLIIPSTHPKKQFPPIAYASPRTTPSLKVSSLRSQVSWKDTLRLLFPFTSENEWLQPRSFHPSSLVPNYPADVLTIPQISSHPPPFPLTQPHPSHPLSPLPSPSAKPNPHPPLHRQNLALQPLPPKDQTPTPTRPPCVPPTQSKQSAARLALFQTRLPTHSPTYSTGPILLVITSLRAISKHARSPRKPSTDPRARISPSLLWDKSVTYYLTIQREPVSHWWRWKNISYIQSTSHDPTVN